MPKTSWLSRKGQKPFPIGLLQKSSQSHHIVHPDFLAIGPNVDIDVPIRAFRAAIPPHVSQVWGQTPARHGITFVGPREDGAQNFRIQSIMIGFRDLNSGSLRLSCGSQCQYLSNCSIFNKEKKASPNGPHLSPAFQRRASVRNFTTSSSTNRGDQSVSTRSRAALPPRYRKERAHSAPTNRRDAVEPS